MSSDLQAIAKHIALEWPDLHVAIVELLDARDSAHTVLVERQDTIETSPWKPDSIDLQDQLYVERVAPLLDAIRRVERSYMEVINSKRTERKKRDQP